MQFNKPTEEELNKAMGHLEIGTADFQVKAAEEAVSKAGNPMIKVTLEVQDKNGTSGTMFDYLLAAYPIKIKFFCEAIGEKDMYESANLVPEKLINRKGKCDLKKDLSSDKGYLKISKYLPLADQQDDDIIPPPFPDDDIAF